jgi:large subunit ribosomal protein L31
MKKGIHPKVNNATKVTCSCGNTFTTTSVLDDIHVEVCSNCHPFYTGVEKFVDTEGRVEKFQKKQSLADKKQKEIKARIKAKKAKEQKDTSGPLSLKDMLKQAGK